MKSTFSRIAVVAMTLWLGLAAGAANAATSTISFSGNSTTGYFAPFTDTHVASSFSDWFNFTIPALSSGHGVAGAVSDTTVTLNATLPDVNFTAFNLWTGTGPSPSGPEISVGNTTGHTNANLFFVGTPGANYALNVAGTRLVPLGGGPDGYDGAVVISAQRIVPVPEPEIYAMMLAGLGLLGFSARRRNENT